MKKILKPCFSVMLILVILLSKTTTASANHWMNWGTPVSNYSHYKNDTTLTHIDMSYVTEVGYEAYANCTSLATANMARKVEIINDRAFYNCTSLIGIRSTNSSGSDPIKKIGNYAFYNCDSFNSLTIKYAGWSIFNGPYEVSVKQTFNHVETIGCYAFTECDGLSNIQFDILKEVSWGAFERCRNLKTAIFPQATYVNDYAFYDAFSLTNVQIPKAAVVDHCAFLNARSLETLSIPSVTAIGNGTFQGCSSLKHMTLGATPPWVGRDAFKGLPDERYLTIPLESLFKYDPDRDGKWMGWTLPKPSKECDMLSFSFDGFTHQRKGQIANTNWIWITVPPGTNLSSIVPTIEVSPLATVWPPSGVPQNFSNCNSNNQADLLRYTVRSQSGGETKHYYVHIQEATSYGKDIHNFTIKLPNVMGTINEGNGTINVWLPCNVGDAQADFTKLVPLIQVSPGATIIPASAVETDFDNKSVTYTVTAIDGSTKQYKVNVQYNNNIPTIRDDAFGTPCDWMTSKRRIDVTGVLNNPISIDMTGTYKDLENDELTYYSFGPIPGGIGNENIYTVFTHVFLLQGKDGHVKLDNNIFKYTPTSSGTKTYLLFGLDGKPVDQSHTETYVLTITTPYPTSNNPPKMIVSNSVEENSIIVNDIYKLDLTPIFSDPDNDPLTYLYSDDGGNCFNQFSGTDFSYQPTTVGDSRFIFKVSDGTNYSGTYTVNLHVTDIVAQNIVPRRIVGVPATASASGAPFELDLSTVFEDVDDDVLSYKVSIDGGAYKDAEKIYSFTPESVGTYTLEFIANDGKADSTDTYKVQLQVDSINVIGIDINLSNTKVNKGVVANLVNVLPYTLTPSSATIQGVTWHSSNPHVLSVDNLTGMLEAKEIGVATVTITSDDTTNGTISDACTVYVVENTPLPSEVKRGNIVGTLVDQHGTPLAGHGVTLFSSPITVVTDSAGRFRFTNVPFTDHTLVVNSPSGVEQGRIGMNFSQGSGVSFNIDPSQNINITFTQNTTTIEMTLENDSGIYVHNVGIKEKIPEKVPNPETGIEVCGNVGLYMLIGVLSVLIIITIISTVMRLKHK